MKRTYNTWIAAALIGLALSQPVYSCGVSWTVPKDHFDGVNERGYVSIWQQIGTLDLGEELKIPLIIGFESNREWSSPHVGQGFILALLDSRFEQVDENLFRMIQPDGWTSVFRRDHKIKNILGGQGGWKAEITGDNTITAYATCGWKLVYKQGKISSIGTPKGRTLDYVYSGGRVAEIREKGSVVLSVKTDTLAGKVSSIVFKGQEITLTQSDRPQVQLVKDQKLITGMNSVLSSVNDNQGTGTNYSFSVDEKLNPSLKIDQTRLLVWDPVTKLILRDGSWSYRIIPGEDASSYASIERSNPLVKRELWFLNAAKGERTQIFSDGTKEVMTWFTSGSVTGQPRTFSRSIDGRLILEEKYSYDDKGKLLRKLSNTTGFAYSAQGLESVNLNGKPIYNLNYQNEGTK